MDTMSVISELKKLSPSVSQTEQKALSEFLTISARKAQSGKDIEDQLLFSLSLALRRTARHA